MKHTRCSPMIRLALVALLASAGCTLPSDPLAGAGSDLAALLKTPELGGGLRWSAPNLPRLGRRTPLRSPAPRPSALSRPSAEPTQADNLCRPSGQGSVVIEPRGSFGPLPRGAVELRLNGRTIAGGATYASLDLPAGCPVEARVTIQDLADAPTLSLNEISLGRDGEVRHVPVTTQTGLVRVRALVDGRRISGVARLFQVNPRSGVAATAASATMGANDVAREISAGTYEVRLSSRGETLSERVTIGAGQSRRVTLGE